MTLPLYNSASTSVPRTRPAAGNTGLWFDKYCNQWCLDSQKSGLEAWSLKVCSIGQGQNRQEINPKFDWIKTVTNQSVGDAKLLSELTERLSNLASTLRGQSMVFTTISRFATGLGREHPIENGFAWHSSLGVPYLPGSSVKGLVRAYAATWCEPPPDKLTHNRIFGPSNGIGGVIFFDALPITPVQLAADIMTPHYGDYYEGRQNSVGRPEAPGDWLNPTPIPFLTVAISQHFQFAVAPRTPAEQDQHDCSLAAQWLEAALAWLGAGAKTAVGYGRFCRNDDAEKKAVSENIRRKAEADLSARLAKLSPLAGELELACQMGHWEVRKEMFAEAGLIEGWLAKLEVTPDADAIRRLGGLVNHHFHGLLTNPEKSEGKKNKPVFKERQRQFARRLNELLTKIS